MTEERRDIYEVANQLGGYVDMSTPQDLADFLLRESKEAAILAERLEIAERHAEQMAAALRVASGRLTWCVSARPGVQSDEGATLVTGWAQEALAALAVPPRDGKPPLDAPSEDSAAEEDPIVRMVETITLLGAFDPNQTLGTDDVATLSAIAELCDEVPQNEGAPFWSMKSTERRDALRFLAETRRLDRVAEQSTPTTTDHLGMAMKRLLCGGMRNPVLMSREEIEATYRAAQHLRPVGVDYDVSRLEAIMRHW